MGLIRLTRPIDVVLFLAAVLLGGWLAGGAAAFAPPAVDALLGAALSAALIGSGANVVNDVYDVEIDRVNRRDRPLVTGEVSLRGAWLLWAVLSTGGIVAAVGASRTHVLVAAASVGLLWAYAAALKRLPGVGHVVVGLVVAFGVVYGAMAAGPDMATAPPVAAAAGLTLVLVTSREIVKAIPDVAGDRADRAATLPVVLGARRSCAIALLGVGGALAALPWFPGAGYDMLFLAYSIPHAAFLLAGAWALLTADAMGPARPTRWAACATRASGHLKAALAMGVIALALGR